MGSFLKHVSKSVKLQLYHNFYSGIADFCFAGLFFQVIESDSGGGWVLFVFFVLVVTSMMTSL